MDVLEQRMIALESNARARVRAALELRHSVKGDAYLTTSECLTASTIMNVLLTNDGFIDCNWVNPADDDSKMRVSVRADDVIRWMPLSRGTVQKNLRALDRRKHIEYYNGKIEFRVEA